jgi:hypothetical protein
MTTSCTATARISPGPASLGDRTPDGVHGVPYVAARSSASILAEMAPSTAHSASSIVAYA